MGKRAWGAVLGAAIAIGAAVPGVAPAAEPPVTELVGVTPLGSDVQRFHYRYGPITVPPGGNLNLVGPVTIEKPPYEGYAIRSKPDLVRADGSVPNVDVIHLHHAVFANLSARDVTAPNLPERFGGTGEEKTIGTLPKGYGYPVRPSDVWALNHMVHNQTTATETVWITYDIDFVPKDSPLGRETVPVRPVWMDVENGKQYPVFDVHRGTGGKDRRFTYPREARDPYGDGPPRNVWKVPRRGNLVATAGHVHPGGLWTDLKLARNERQRRIYRSRAKYYDPNGPISWDLSMTHSDEPWRVGVRKGDRLRISATYETKRASWYESMGINLVWMAYGEKGPNPFRRRVDVRGHVTHGHLPENENYGGEPQQGVADPTELPDGQTLDNRVGIAGFQYYPGGFGLPGEFSNPPTVEPGQSLRFENADSSAAGTMHSITACKPPCNASTGISYPLANGPEQFDSGNLGYGPSGSTAAANRHTWETPKDLGEGTYTYFCRIHPFMRGAFRVKR
jgi:plastocyanin